MHYWKFLRSGGLGPFTGHPWSSDGRWIEAGASRQCSAGIHACRAGDLPYWTTDELWKIELAEPVVAGRCKVVSPSGRLVARVQAWDGATAERFKHACLDRIAHHATAELGDAGLPAAALRLGDARAHFAETRDLEAMRSVAERCAATSLGKRQANLISMLLVDAVDSMAVYPAAMLSHIAAHAADKRTRVDTQDPYEAERRWQAQWLHRTLGLAAGG